ncbi:MAG: PepSY-associated TM helix domain-containing protein, partial [Pseudomonadota bacterium]
MRKTLRYLHRWIGLPVGVVLFVTLLSGASLGFTDLVGRFDSKGQIYRVTTIEEDARAIQALLDTLGRPRQIIFPTEGAPFYEARARGESVALSIGELEILEHATGPRSATYAWLLRLHRSLNLGRDRFQGVRGADIVAWVSLFAIGIGLVGLYLWLPTWRQFSLRNLWPRGWRRAKLLQSHFTGGVVSFLA